MRKEVEIKNNQELRPNIRCNFIPKIGPSSLLAAVFLLPRNAFMVKVSNVTQDQAQTATKTINSQQ